MPIFKVTVTHRGESGQKTFLENVTNQLQSKSARIINMQSKVGKVEEPHVPINVVTISYEAPREIKLPSNFLNQMKP